MDKKYHTVKQKLNKLEHIQTRTPTHTKTFYPRVTNNTNIKFTAEELSLLNKGLKYNLSYKNKNWIRTLALETETAITQLPTHEQDYVRIQAAHNLKQIYKQQSAKKQYNSNHATREHHILNHIKEKLSFNEAIISKADKGNSIVIIYLKDYHSKVQTSSPLKKTPPKNFITRSQLQ